MPEHFPEIVHEGTRWILGHDAAGYGIWERGGPGAIGGEPAARFDGTPDGLTAASQLFSHWEQLHSEATAAAYGELAGAPGMPPRPSRSQLWWWALPVGVVVLVAIATAILIGVHGSGNQATSARGGSTTTTTSPPVGNGYLSSNSNTAIFIQWNQSGQSVSGTAQADSITGSPPNESLSTNTITVTGQQNGSTISLSFNGHTEEFGTITSGSFTLNFPQSDGSLAPVTFQQSSTSAFNSAVAALNAAISQANQTAAEKAQIQKQQAAINGDLQTVNDDITTLNRASFSTDLGSLSGDVSKASTDLAASQQEAQIANGEQGAPNQCNDAATSENEAAYVENDAGYVQNVANQVESDATSMRGLISKASSDYQQLQSDEGNLPSYQVNAPSLSNLNQAIASAQGAIATAIGTVNTAIGQVNSDQAAAFQAYSAALNQAGNCGPAAPAPSAIQTIS